MQRLWLDLAFVDGGDKRPTQACTAGRLWLPWLVPVFMDHEDKRMHGVREGAGARERTWDN